MPWALQKVLETITPVEQLWQKHIFKIKMFD
jgi:hypothetical protein